MVSDHDPVPASGPAEMGGIPYIGHTAEGFIRRLQAAALDIPSG